MGQTKLYYHPPTSTTTKHHSPPVKIYQPRFNTTHQQPKHFSQETHL